MVGVDARKTEKTVGRKISVKQVQGGADLLLTEMET